jgi:hypothetical protein
LVPFVEAVVIRMDYLSSIECFAASYSRFWYDFMVGFMAIFIASSLMGSLNYVVTVI